MQAANGYPLRPAETFVDISRASGNCYGAANWRSPGTVRWHCYVQPTEISVFDLTDTFSEEMRTRFGFLRRYDLAVVPKDLLRPNAG